MSDLAQHWQLEPGLDFLNHGSFGACPRRVLEAQQEMRLALERQPVEFFVRELQGRLDAAREALAVFLGAEPEGLVPVSNATGGVNAVLRSLEFDESAELLVTDHAYNACRNALDHVAALQGARVVVVRLPFPCGGPEEIVEVVMRSVTPRTRLALIDHVTSPTGMVLPIRALVERLARQGIDTLVDGAHAPGMLALDLREINAAYYAGNCHKWICAPKGAGFLYIRDDLRESVRPLTISHGANTSRPGRSRLHDEFDWTGTRDPTAFLCVPVAIDCVGSLVDGGWPEVRERNRSLALEARRLLARELDVSLPCPDEMIGSLASLPLPDGAPEPPVSALYSDPLQELLVRQHRIEVPIVPWPAPPKRLLRVSAQLYNHAGQYERLATLLRRELQATGQR